MNKRKYLFIEMNFETAINRVKELDNRPGDDEMLQLYGLYKQATVGDVNTECPSFWDLTGKAKWNAWNSYKGLTKEDAQSKYVSLVESLISLN